MNSKLVIKFLKGHKKEAKFHFGISQMPLTMGREKSNGIVFESDDLMSRVHCQFDYINDSWMISDIRNRSSGNGTWKFCD